MFHRRPRPLRAARRQAGQSIVEFALVSLTLLMLMFGIIDLGRGVFARVMLTNAVREAARNGMVADRRNLAGADFESNVVAAAANRSPSLGLNAANISSPGGAIKCYNWGAPPSEQHCSRASASTVTIADAGERLTVCARYQFGLTAPRLIELDSITMTECADVTLQR